MFRGLTEETDSCAILLLVLRLGEAVATVTRFLPLHTSFSSNASKQILRHIVLQDLSSAYSSRLSSRVSHPRISNQSHESHEPETIGAQAARILPTSWVAEH